MIIEILFLWFFIHKFTFIYRNITCTAFLFIEVWYIEILPINFLLRSSSEQRNIIMSFMSYLKIAPVKIQFKVVSKKADISEYIEKIKEEAEREPDHRVKLLQEDYAKLIERLGRKEAITRRFFMVFEYQSYNNNKNPKEREVLLYMRSVVQTAKKYLFQCGNVVLEYENDTRFLVDVLYQILNRKTSVYETLEERIKKVARYYQRENGRESISHIPVTELIAPETMDMRHRSHLVIDGMYYSYLLIPSHKYRTIEKRLRLHRMSKVWVFLWKTGIPIFRSQKPELFCSDSENGRGQAAYYGSLEFKGLTDAIKGSRACGIMLSGESGYIIYHTLAQKMRWAKKMERSIRSFVERECMKAGALKRIDAVIMGDTIEFLVELLESDGGIKGNLFQVDDIYENYYYIPTIESAKIQVKLLTDKEKQIGLYRFLCGILEQPGTCEYQVSAGTDQTGNPVYFCYELELRHLLRVKQELGWKKQGTILCFSYQKSILEYYFGKEVSYREILTEKVMEYLEGL